MHRKAMSLFTTLLFSLVIAGCGSIQDAAETDLVSEAAIVGAWKCALAQALVREAEPGRVERLKGRVAKLSLGLKVVDTTNISASIAAKASGDGPFVFTLGSGTGSILPSASGSVQKTNTIQTDVDMRFALGAENTDVCTAQAEGSQAKYRFSSWLAKVIAGLDANVDYQPYGVTDRIHQFQSFGVTRTGRGALDFDIVFLSSSVAADATRNDVQTIELTIAAPSKDFPAPKFVNLGTPIGRQRPAEPGGVGGAAPRGRH